MGSYIENLKKEFPTEEAFQLALFNYVYNGNYKEELQTIKDLGTPPKFIQDYVKESLDEDIS